MKTQTFNLIPFTIIVLLVVLTSSNVSVVNSLDVDAENLATEIYITEKELEIESWMTNDYLWSFKNEMENSDESAMDEGIFEIEEWMFDDEIWRF